MKRAIFLVIAFLAAGHLSSALGEPLAEAEDALRKRDPATALQVLEKASAEGNVAAKGRLASYLRNLPPPYRDVDRACALARQASEAADPMGSVTRAECLISGAEKTEKPCPVARELARQALRAGFPTAGFTLYVVYSMDPEYSYPAGGGDRTKYNALAALPISARSDQIEAFDGLAEAIRVGHMGAAQIALGYFVESSAPGNIDRVVALANLFQKSGEQIPQRLVPFVRLAQQIRSLGITHASVSAFNDAYKSAALGAAIQIRGLGDKSDCDVKEIKLLQVSAEPVNGAEYLPVSKPPFVNTYLVRGNWSETWTFAGCQKTVPVRIAFTADGWSGARFQTVYQGAGAK